MVQLNIYIGDLLLLFPPFLTPSFGSIKIYKKISTLRICTHPQTQTVNKEVQS